MCSESVRDVRDKCEHVRVEYEHVRVECVRGHASVNACECE